MTLTDCIIPATRIDRFEEPWHGPLAILRLAEAAGSTALRLPECPFIGVGEPGHPLAPHCDVVVRSMDELPVVCDNVLRHPRAAAALVQVLRISEKVSPSDALTIESFAYAMLQGSDEHRAWQAARLKVPALAPGQLAVSRHGDDLDVLLDRPWAGNAIDRPMRDALSEVLTLASLDPALQVRLRGRGKAFSLGADLAEFGTTDDPAEAHAIRGLTLPARAALGCAERLEVHVDGACVGAGLELAAFAKRVTATARSWFQLPELGMGVIPGAGGCVSAPRRIGRQRAAWMVLSGRRIGARQALAWGLIDAIVDPLPADEGGADIV